MSSDFLPHENTSHGSVTDSCHTTQESLRQFYKIALHINEVEQRPFSKLDFPNISADYYRQIIHRLKSHLELVIPGRPKFWKVKGAILTGDSHRVTKKGTWDIKIFEDSLRSVEYQPVKFHDIKLKFTSDLHSKLVENGCSFNHYNKSIKVDYPYLDNNIITKVMVYPDTTQIDIGNTYQPIIYDYGGFLFLIQHLSCLHHYLLSLCSFEAHIPHVKDWILTHYHLNKDSSARFSGQTFCIDLESAGIGLSRYYSKKMTDGNSIVRYEQIMTPRISLEEQTTRLLQ